MPVDAVADMLAALDLPASDELTRRTRDVSGRDLWRHARRLVTRETARRIFTTWQPSSSRADDARFLGHFRDLLADAIALGYRLERFRELAARLPDPSTGARNWIAPFEEVLTGDDCATIRFFLTRRQHQAFLATNRHPSDGRTWDQLIAMACDGLFYELGIVFRPPEILVDDALATSEFRCEWNDLRLPAQQGLDDQTVLVSEPPDRLPPEIAGTPAVNPANGNACSMVDRSHREAAEAAGLTTWDARGYAILGLSAAIRRAAPALVNRPFYELYVFRLREFNPDLVSVLEETMEPDFVLQVLRGLLAEEISVRDGQAILQAVLELRSTLAAPLTRYITFEPPTGGVYVVERPQSRADAVPADFVEFVRWRHQRYISHKYTQGQNSLGVYLLDPEAEDALADPELDESIERAILTAVSDEVGPLVRSVPGPVILTTAGVRSRLRRLIAPEFPDLAVLAYQELSPDMNIQPIARISPEF
jgi:type III secretion protein V